MFSWDKLHDQEEDCTAVRRWIEAEMEQQYRVRTWENHRLDSRKEKDVHGAKALAAHNVHLPAQEYLSSNETGPDKRPGTDGDDVAYQR